MTGSAHCSLGPYWEEKLGKKELRAFQVRRNEISVFVRGGRRGDMHGVGSVGGMSVHLNRIDIYSPSDKGVKGDY